MTFKETIRTALKDFESLMNAIYFSGWKTFGYMALFSLLMSIPLVLDLSQSFFSAKEDLQTIAKQVPDFTVKDGSLAVDNEAQGGIFLTDSLIFTLDATGKRTAENVVADASSSAASVGFLPHEMVVGLPKGLSEFIPQDSLSFSYQDSNLKNFSKKDFAEITQIIPNNFWIAFFILVFLATLFDFSVTLVFITFFCMIFSRLFSLQMRFRAVYKMAVVASLWGVLVATILNFAHIPYDSVFLIGIPTVLVYMKSLKDLALPKN